MSTGDIKAPRSTSSFGVARLMAQYVAVRTTTDRLCDTLEPDDFIVQSDPDTSPVKWHLGHTTRFFERFLLIPFSAGYKPFEPKFNALFDDHSGVFPGYQSRSSRGLLCRPTLSDVTRFRVRVDESIQSWLASGISLPMPVEQLLELGIAHEQQHQEQLLADLKHAFFLNPMQPAYAPKAPIPKPAEYKPAKWIEFQGGLVPTGYTGVSFAWRGST
jgi:hypothetical protein